MTTSAAPDQLRGLRADEVADRVARGLTNDLPDSPTRTIGEIVKANVFTYFNMLLGSLFVIILVVGPANDALFGGVIVANTLVGVVQEVRAKRTLDRLAVLSSPRARVRRDGEEFEVAVREVVLDDIVVLAPGDQVVVDGEVLEIHGLEVDESLLTGESDPVVKQSGDEVQSGSFVAAGGGAFRATRVGRDAYASQVAEEARRFTLSRSELRSGIDWIVHLVSYLMIPTGGLLLFSQITGHAGISDAIRATVAGVVAMVPEGLVLLTSVAFALGVVRLGKRQVLVQELPAVETLARVDVICLDKTGTITEGELTLDQLLPCAGADTSQAAGALAAVISADPNPNATQRALLSGLADTAAGGEQATGESSPITLPEVTRSVPFSSARKWSAATLADGTTWVLGAPDVLLRAVADPGDLPAKVE
jgi:cation-transporting ATPase E